MDSTTLYDANEWGLLTVEAQYQNDHTISELPTEGLDALDQPNDSVYGEITAMLDYPDSYLDSRASTTLEDIFHPYLPYPEPQNQQGSSPDRHHGNGIHLRTRGRMSPPIAHDDFSSSFLGFTSVKQDVNGAISKQERCERSPGAVCGQEETSPSESNTNTHQQTRKRPLRRQNHACDTCRSSKKACDLPLEVAIGRGYKVSKECTTCKIRGVECTAEWLSKKQSLKQAKKRSKMSEQSPINPETAEDGQKTSLQDTFGILTPASSAETELSRQLIAQSICSENFHLYVHTYDMPVTQCLLSGTMPPRYSLGIGAYIPLCNSPRVSVHIQKASSWVETCWPVSLSNHVDPATLVATPHLFSAMSVLDALFFDSRASHSKSMPKSTRDFQITEAYKWVAVAMSAQFFLRNIEHSNAESRNKFADAKIANLRDVAFASWRKARDMLFRNIAATNSFRLATSLVIFGIISPAVESPEDRQTCEEDSRYALHEGLSRLRSLSSQARCRLEATAAGRHFQMLPEGYNNDPIQDLYSDDRANVLELIGAVEWMVSLINSVIIGTSRGAICPLPFDNDDSGIVTQDCLWLEDTKSCDPYEVEIEELILARAEGTSKSAVMCQELGEDDAMIRVGREASAITILLWRSLARFVMAAEALDYDAISRWHVTTVTLINLWRGSFGSADASTVLSFKKPWSHRIFAFYSNDADVAILLFHEAVQKLGASVSVQSSNPAERRLANILFGASGYHRTQRLLSASMISVIAATYNDMVPLEDQPSITELDSIALHPVSVMLCYTYRLPRFLAKH